MRKSSVLEFFLLIFIALISRCYSQYPIRNHTSLKDLPNPQKDYSTCGRFKASYLCDPHYLVVSRLWALDNSLENFRKPIVDLKKQPCLGLTTGYDVRVAVAKKLPDDTDLQQMAKQVVSNWGMPIFGTYGCQNGILLFLSLDADDLMVQVIPGREAARKLTQQKIDKIQSNMLKNFGKQKKMIYKDAGPVIEVALDGLDDALEIKIGVQGIIAMILTFLGISGPVGCCKAFFNACCFFCCLPCYTFQGYRTYKDYRKDSDYRYAKTRLFELETHRKTLQDLSLALVGKKKRLDSRIILALPVKCPVYKCNEQKEVALEPCGHVFCKECAAAIIYNQKEKFSLTHNIYTFWLKRAPASMQLEIERVSFTNCPCCNVSPKNSVAFPSLVDYEAYMVHMTQERGMDYLLQEFIYKVKDLNLHAPIWLTTKALKAIIKDPYNQEDARLLDNEDFLSSEKNHLKRYEGLYKGIDGEIYKELAKYTNVEVVKALKSTVDKYNIFNKF